MIEWLETESRQHWARHQGRALCSSRDPRREAAQWCDQNSFLERFGHVDVVGIGLGYHLFEIQSRWPQLKVRAFDVKPELSLASMPRDLRERFLVLGPQFDLHFFARARRESIRELPLGPVLKFVPACFGAENELYEALLGQTPEAFARWSELSGFHGVLPALKSVTQNLAVNIKSLNDSLCDFTTDEGKALAALKELVE